MFYSAICKPYSSTNRSIIHRQGANKPQRGFALIYHKLCMSKMKT